MNKCRRERNDAVIVFEENTRKMTFRNPNRRTVTEVRVDGCEITDGLKCDFLLIEPEQTEHFVELKGGDIAHACRQILATHQQLSRKRAEVFAWVVSSKFPQDDSTLRQLKMECRRRRIKLAIKNSQQSYQLP